MTYLQALEELFESEQFKEQAKSNSNLRVYLLRHRNGTLKDLSGKNLLLSFGYKESYESPFKKKRKKQ